MPPGAYPLGDINTAHTSGSFASLQGKFVTVNLPIVDTPRQTDGTIGVPPPGVDTEGNVSVADADFLFTQSTVSATQVGYCIAQVCGYMLTLPQRSCSSWKLIMAAFRQQPAHQMLIEPALCDTQPVDGVAAHVQCGRVGGIAHMHSRCLNFSATTSASTGAPCCHTPFVKLLTMPPSACAMALNARCGMQTFFTRLQGSVWLTIDSGKNWAIIHTFPGRATPQEEDDDEPPPINWNL